MALNITVSAQSHCPDQTCFQTQRIAFLSDKAHQLEARLLWCGVWQWSGSAQWVYQL